jgi:hypothetical protein
VGPIVPTDGLQLSGTGSPGALLQAFNMEQRQKELRTRRGSRVLGWCAPPTLGLNAYNGHALDFAGNAVGYIGLDVDVLDGTWGANPAIPPDTLMVFGAGTGTETVEHGGLTWDYWDGAAWKSLDVDDSAETRQGQIKFPLLESAFAMVRPEDWATGIPTGVAGGDANFAYLRVTRAEGTFVTDPADLTTTAGNNALAWGHAERSRTFQAVSFRTRAKWRTLILAAHEHLGETHLTLYDPDAAFVSNPLNPIPGPKSKALTFGNVGTIDDLATLGSAEDAIVIYMQATDDLLIHVGGKWYIKKTDESAGARDNTLPDFTPDTSGVDTAWEDQQLEGAFPQATAAALLNERLFIAVDGEGLVRWTAPSQFWTILPSFNSYRLSSKGAGSITAMATLHGVLYIFTDSETWAAYEGEPIPGSDSQVSFAQINDIGCVSRRSLAVSDGAIFFLSKEGVVQFNGQEARILTDNVKELFETDSVHEYAIRRPREAHGMWHRLENQYRLYYPTSGHHDGDSCLVVDVSGRKPACYLWGSDFIKDLDTSPNGQRRWGVRAGASTYRPDLGQAFTVSHDGFLAVTDEDFKDGGSPVEWRFETHHLGIADIGKQRLKRVELTIEKEHNSTVTVTAVADGRRKESRTVKVQRDGYDEDGHLGSADSAGEELVDLRDAYGPLIARFAQVGRNHRVRAESVAPDYAHIHLAALTLEVEG